LDGASFNHRTAQSSRVLLRATKREADGLSFYEFDHLDGDVDMIAALKELLAEDRRRPEGEKIVFRPDHGHRMLDDLAAGKRTNRDIRP
jgi:mannonate dehydratase